MINTVIIEWTEDQLTEYGKVTKGDVKPLPKTEAKPYLDRGLCIIPESVMVEYTGTHEKKTIKFRGETYTFIKNRPRVVPVKIAKEVRHFKDSFKIKPTKIPTIISKKEIDPQKHFIIRYNGNFGDVLRATGIAESLHSIGYSVSFHVKKHMEELLYNNPFVKPRRVSAEVIDLDKIRVHALESENVLRTNTWLKAIGLEDSPFRKPSYFPSDDEIEKAKRIVKDDKFTIGLGTNASVPGKTWHGFDELKKKLKPKNRVIELDRKVGGAHPGLMEYRYSLRHVGAIISLCNLIITNDSLILHLAGAMDVPCIGLFGNTNAKVMTQSYPFCVPIQGKCVKKPTLSRRSVKQSTKNPCWYDVCQEYHVGELPCLGNISIDEVLNTIHKMRC